FFKTNAIIIAIGVCAVVCFTVIPFSFYTKNTEFDVPTTQYRQIGSLERQRPFSFVGQTHSKFSNCLDVSFLDKGIDK
ncbi:hypothetical protein TNIN_269091, partial [Trichonephila inaurata madagascariensis]